MNYRLATRKDAPTIVDFQVRMAAETEDLLLDRATCERGVAGVFDDPTRGRYYVAEDRGAVVASLLTTYEWSDWRASAVWWIQSVFVAPEARKGGVYAGLYRFVQDLANQDDSVSGIRLYVDRRNTRAQEVYERQGMNGEHYLVYEWMKSF